jgi:exonuclease VII small subunit
MMHRVELLEENMKRCSQSLAHAESTITDLTKENQALTEK